MHIMCVRVIEKDCMNTIENLEIERLTDDDFNQISRILDCEFAALRPFSRWIPVVGEGSLFPASLPFFSKSISFGIS